MKRLIVYHINAFTTTPNSGNPAGVIENGDNYTEEEMQKITKMIGFNECVFICTSDIADIKLRYFTPGHETPLCGHATMAAIHYLTSNMADNRTYTIETQAGVLSVMYNATDKTIEMQHAKPELLMFTGDIESLCSCLHIRSVDIHQDLPIVYGSTGTWTLLVPVKDMMVLDKMEPETKNFPSILEEKPRVSIHPFTIVNKDAKEFYARHFSSPYSETMEDAVTGTASGVMGAYALDYIYSDAKINLTVHQGKYVQKEGTVHVEAKRNAQGHKIKICGQAVHCKEIAIEL